MPSSRILGLGAALLCFALSACADPAPEQNTTNNANPSPDMSGADLGVTDQAADTQEDAAPDAQDMGADQGVEDLIVLPPKPWDIRKQGPYNVGYRTSSLTYKAKPNERERTLEVVVWYPSLQKQGRKARYLKVLTRDAIIENATIAPEGKFPVMVFSHGNGSLAEQSYYMTEYFTSHGWIVVAPYHTNNTVRDNEGSINYRSALDRPQDISAVIDWLQATPAEDPLAGRFTDDIVLSGHSFGGYTTLASSGSTFAVDEMIAACGRGEVDQRLCDVFSTEDDIQVFRDGFLDPRIKVAIPQTPAGAGFFAKGVSKIKIPTLLMTGALDRSLPNAVEGDPIWENLNGSASNLRLDFKLGGHFTFSNMCELFPSVEQVANDGCADNFIPYATAFPIINVYAMAFARHHLFDDQSEAALLTGQDQPWAEHVDFSSKQPQ